MNVQSNLRVELRFKNAILYRTIEETFGQKARLLQRGPIVPLIQVAAQGLGVSRLYLSGLLNLKRSPYIARRNGQGCPADGALTIAAALGVGFEELFPPELYSGRFENALVAEVDSRRFLPMEAARLLSAPDDPEAGAVRAELKERIKAVLETLSPREATVITMSMGLEDGVEHTFSDIGQTLKVTGNRIRQIHVKALRKLRHPSRSLHLRPDLENYL